MATYCYVNFVERYGPKDFQLETIQIQTEEIHPSTIEGQENGIEWKALHVHLFRINIIFVVFVLRNELNPPNARRITLP